MPSKTFGGLPQSMACAGFLWKQPMMKVQMQEIGVQQQAKVDGLVGLNLLYAGPAGSLDYLQYLCWQFRNKEPDKCLSRAGGIEALAASLHVALHVFTDLVWGPMLSGVPHLFLKTAAHLKQGIGSRLSKLQSGCTAKLEVQLFAAILVEVFEKGFRTSSGKLSECVKAGCRSCCSSAACFHAAEL